MLKQTCETKYIAFIRKLREGSALHTTFVHDNNDVRSTINVSIGDVLDAFLEINPACKQFRDHLISVSLKYATINVSEDAWKGAHEQAE